MTSAPPPIEIDSADDPRLAAFRAVRERELAAREGLFIGETLVVLEAMLEVMRGAMPEPMPDPIPEATTKLERGPKRAATDEISDEASDEASEEAPNKVSNGVSRGVSSEVSSEFSNEAKHAPKREVAHALERRGVERSPGRSADETAPIRAVLASTRMLARTQRLLLDFGCDAPLYTASDEVLEELTGIDLHRGVLAAGLRAPFEPVAASRFAPRTPPRTVLVAEDITNIDNIGQLYRIAAAFAVDAVLLGPTCHDPLYRKSLRVSTGNALKVPSARAERWPGDLADFCARFDLALVSTAIQSSVPLRSVAPPARVAVVVGHESLGVSAATRAISRHIVRIPMAPGVDSLNVAVSAAVALDHFSQGERA